MGKDLATAGVAEILRGMRMVISVNALGLPAVALRVGTGDGLPQSVQVIGARYREDVCLDAAGRGVRAGMRRVVDDSSIMVGRVSDILTEATAV